MGDNKLFLTKEPKSFHFDLPKSDYINLTHEPFSITKHHERLAEHVIKNEVTQLLSKYQHGNDIYKQKNSKKIFALNLSQRLDLRSSNKHVAFQTCLFTTPGRM